MKGQEHRNKTACLLWYLWGFRRFREMFPFVRRENMLFFGTCTVKRWLRCFSSGTLLGNEDILRTVERNALKIKLYSLRLVFKKFSTRKLFRIRLYGLPFEYK